MKILSCLQLSTVRSDIIPGKKRFIGNGMRVEDLFQQTLGRTPTQQEVDTITQTGRGANGKAAIDMSPGEFTTWLQNESPIGQQVKTQNAQTAYKTATDTAIGGLQEQKTKLSDQYAELLKTVKEQYDPLVNKTTATTGAELARRGLTPDSTLYKQEVQGALQPVYGAQAGNAQAIGQGSISDMNTLAGNIAGLQIGAAGTSAQIPLQYGSLALSQQALPSQIALAQANAGAANTSARYMPIPNVGVVDLTTGKIISSTGLSSTGRTIVGNY